MPTQNSKMSPSGALLRPSSLCSPHHVVRHRCALLVAALLLLFGFTSFCAGAPTADGQRWNNGVGLWGKRSNDLANLALFNGLMDEARSVRKRPEHGWHKLNALWGKRSSNSNWQTANGLWGKRSVPPMQQMVEENGE